MNLFISSAHAQSLGGLAGFDFMSILPLLLIFVVFYFFLIRPQQKKAQQHKDLLKSLRRGDRIVTNGGLIGTIVKVVSDQEVQVEIAEDVRVRIARAMVAEVISKTTPAAAEPSEPSAPTEKSQKPKKTTAKKTTSKQSMGRSKQAS